MELIQERLDIPGYEKVVYGSVPEAGLEAIISVHSLALGPACGGCRLLPYTSRDEALEDVLRLSRGMSYKSALAGNRFGGGKSVILCDPAKKTPKLFEAMGKFVDTFGGDYITAKDMNVDSDDLRTLKKNTRHALGIDGEVGSSGDPSPVTARGVFRSMEAAWNALHGTRSLEGVTVAIQGVGYVGRPLAEWVKGAGAKLVVTDVDQEALQWARTHLEAEVVGLDQIYDVDCQIFAPCARGAVLNSETLPRLRCEAVVGAANNQLATPDIGHELHGKGILYVPDYAVNAGGIINVFVEYEGYDEGRALRQADGIYDTISEILQRAKTDGEPPFILADRIAEERMAKG